MIEALTDIYVCIFFFNLGWFISIAIDDEESARSVISVIAAVFLAAVWPITVIVAVCLGNKKKEGDEK